MQPLDDKLMSRTEGATRAPRTRRTPLATATALSISDLLLYCLLFTFLNFLEAINIVCSSLRVARSRAFISLRIPAPSGHRPRLHYLWTQTKDDKNTIV